MKFSYVSLAVLVAAALGLQGCSKKGGEKKKDVSGDEGGGETGGDDTTPPDPCSPLRLQDGDDDEDDDDSAAQVTVEEEDTDDDAQDPALATEVDTGCGGGGSGDDTPSTGGGTSWNAGDKGLDGCNADGKAWKAVVSGGPAQCGGDLVDWCCSRGEAKKRFPGLAGRLDTAFDGVEGRGLKLYNCSVDSGATFHFAGVKDGKVVYETINTKGGVPGPGNPKADSCVAVTYKDMGIDAVLTAAEDDDDDESSIPKTIGELTDADDEDAVRDWLKNAAITSGVWARNARQDGAHHGATNVTKFRTSYNKTMRDGFAEADADKKLPVGSLAIKTLYNADLETLGYVIMGKAKDTEGADNWLFFEVKGDNADDWKAATPGVHGLGVAACVACHTGNHDRNFIKGTVPAP